MSKISSWVTIYFPLILKILKLSVLFYVFNYKERNKQITIKYTFFI